VCLTVVYAVGGVGGGIVGEKCVAIYKEKNHYVTTYP